MYNENQKTLDKEDDFKTQFMTLNRDTTIVQCKQTYLN